MPKPVNNMTKNDISEGRCSWISFGCMYIQHKVSDAAMNNTLNELLGDTKEDRSLTTVPVTSLIVLSF
ncbi:hypothetical protein BADSM9389_35520 [Buttiauxella agrestis]|nr:hypothetical protein BADSM9389_35520 [Buttiauxella agrestis]